MKKLYFLTLFLFVLVCFTSHAQTEIQLRNVLKDGPIHTYKPDTIPEQSEEAFYILLNSNIEFAQLGGGFIFKTTKMNNSIILNVKVSGDYLSRKLAVQTPQSYNSSRPFDINEIIVTGSFLFNLTENISYWLGAGIFTGQMVQIKSISENTWQPVDKKVGVHPVATWGIALGKQRVKLLVGYEAAFVNSEVYPSNQLNSKATVKLTSATIGIAFKLGNN